MALGGLNGWVMFCPTMATPFLALKLCTLKCRARNTLSEITSLLSGPLFGFGGFFPCIASDRLSVALVEGLNEKGHKPQGAACSRTPVSDEGYVLQPTQLFLFCCSSSFSTILVLAIQFIKLK